MVFPLHYWFPQSQKYKIDNSRSQTEKPEIMDARAILNILMGLGWRHVVLVSDLETRHLTNVYHELTSNGIFTQLQSVNESLQQGYSLRLEAIPYIVIGDMRRHVQIMEKYGSYRKPPLTFALMTSDEELFLTVKVSTSFYLINPATESLTYIQTFAHSDHVVSNIWIRNESTHGSKKPSAAHANSKNLCSKAGPMASISLDLWLSREKKFKKFDRALFEKNWFENLPYSFPPYPYCT